MSAFGEESPKVEATCDSSKTRCDRGSGSRNQTMTFRCRKVVAFTVIPCVHSALLVARQDISNSKMCAEDKSYIITLRATCFFVSLALSPC